jgi:hypothetical protein
MNFQAFCEIQRLINVFTRSLHRSQSLSQINSIHTIPSCFSRIYLNIKSRGVTFRIATDYELDDGWIGFRVHVGSRILSLHVVQTGPGTHPASYPMGTGDSFHGVKRPEREAEHTSSVEVNKTWVYW